MRGPTFLTWTMSALLVAAAASGQHERGERLYNAHCSWCHGVGGEGGEGPNLARPRLRLAPDDDALRELIRTGSPRNGMPGVFSINDEEVAAVAAYVRSLGTVAAVELPGDPEAGRRVYLDQSCDTCHIVGGEGQGVGPELTEIGLRRAAPHLRESILEPAKAVDEEYRVLTVTTADGESIRGLRIREDPFTVVIRDGDNRIRSFQRRELDSVRRRMTASVMPAYDRRLTPEETDHLVAYLAALRGEEP